MAPASSQHRPLSRMSLTMQTLHGRPSKTQHRCISCPLTPGTQAVLELHCWEQNWSNSQAVNVDLILFKVTHKGSIGSVKAGYEFMTPSLLSTK
jgi:hypothetical protein